MPYRDKTGPEGKGPRTGRGLGNCKTTSKIDDTMKEVTSKIKQKGEKPTPSSIVNNIIKKKGD